MPAWPRASRTRRRWTGQQPFHLDGPAHLVRWPRQCVSWPRMRQRILQGRCSPSTAACTCDLVGGTWLGGRGHRDYQLPTTNYQPPTGGQMAVADKVKSIIVEQLGVDEEEVTPDASFVDDLGADSLDTVELVMAFEEEFGIEIPDEDAEKITRVKEAVEYIDAHAKSKK